MSLVQKTLRGQSKVSVLIVHHADVPVMGSLENIKQLSGRDQIKRVLILKVESGSNSASLISEGVSTPIDLKTAIASIEKVQAVELISVCSAYLNSDSQRKLDEEARVQFEELTISAPKGCQSGIIAFICLYFEILVILLSFKGEATSRLIVLPEDKQNDFSFGNGLREVSDESYLWHIAIKQSLLLDFG